MNTQKLDEALIEMKHQRALLDAAIKNIESVLSSLGGNGTSNAVPSGSRKREGGSYIELGAQILAENGSPMHIRDIAAKISEKRGKTIPRASVESSFIRHISSLGAESAFVKVRPAYFALSVWKNLYIDKAKHNAA